MGRAELSMDVSGFRVAQPTCQDDLGVICHEMEVCREEIDRNEQDIRGVQSKMDSARAYIEAILGEKRHQVKLLVKAFYPTFGRVYKSERLLPRDIKRELPVLKKLYLGQIVEQHLAPHRKAIESAGEWIVRIRGETAELVGILQELQADRCSLLDNSQQLIPLKNESSKPQRGRIGECFQKVFALFSIS